MKSIIKVSTTTNGVQSKAQIRNHEVIIDEPVAAGGQDMGPTPLGLLVGALAGCENVIAHKTAKDINFDLQHIEFDVEARFDRRGLMGDPTIRPYFEKVTVHAKVRTSESQERVKELQEKTDLRCPVITMMKAAGVELEADWRKETDQ